MDKMVKISRNKWSLTFIGEMQPDETLELPKAENEESNDQSDQPRLCAPSAVIQVELHEVEKGQTFRVSFSRKNGSTLAFQQIVDTMRATVQEANKV